MDEALQRENVMVLNLSQALQGAVFPRLLATSVEVRDSRVIVYFRVDSNPDDLEREELEDIVVDFEAFVGPSCMIGGANEVSSELRIGPGSGAGSNLPGRLVFSRKVS